MTDPFEDMSFLMGSCNRVRILQVLADRSLTRRELVEEIGASSITVGRILDDFLDRGWIERRGEAYAATLLGDAIAEDTSALETSVEVAQQFGPEIGYLPREDVDFDPRHLADAELTRSPQDDAFEHIDRWIQLFRSADRVSGVTSNMPGILMDVLNEEARTRDMTMEAVFTDDVVARLSEQAETRRWTRELLEAGADLYELDDAEWDCGVAVYDDRLVSIAGFDEVGTPKLKIESESDPLREWAESTVRRYRDRASPLGVDDFAE